MTSLAKQVSGVRFQAPGGENALLRGKTSAPSPNAESFMNALAKIRGMSGEGGGNEALTDAANKLVSSAFVLPVLSSMHDSPLRPKSGPFSQGTIEKRFGPLLDQQFADRITKASNFGIVRSIVDRYGKQQAAQTQHQSHHMESTPK